MSWNYRIIKFGEEDYGLHEVYYFGNKPINMTERPIIVGDDPNEIIADLEMMLADAKRLPVMRDFIKEGY